MDIALVDLYEGLDYLGQITGKIVTEDIVDRIFENFVSVNKPFVRI